MNIVILIRERFSLLVYGPMIFVFTLFNAMISQSFKGLLSIQFSILFLMMLSFFLRMRFFDEIKDYRTDLKIHPDRPLARGAVSIPEVKKWLMSLILFELVLSYQLGSMAFLVHSCAIFYSLLMYEEFFIGDWLGPRLTRYAVSHTFVSFIMSISVVVATGVAVQELSQRTLLLLLSNWMYFNLFEFARKTFSLSEEKQNVQSYSSIFGTRGAYLLSLSQVILGQVLIYQYFFLKGIPSYIGSLVFFIFSLPYLFNPGLRQAHFFRTVSSIYLLAHYLLMVFILWS